MARPLAQEVLERMLDAAPDAVVAVHADGTIVYTNAQVRKLFGYGEGELVGQPIEVLVPARFRDVHRRHRGDYFGRPVTRPMGEDLDLHARRKDGSEFPAEISLSAIETGEGRLATAAIRDITARRQAEAALAEARAELSRRELARRQAVDINDNIIQGLTLALYDAQRLEASEVARTLEPTLDEARRIVNELQEGKRIQPGELRRMGGAPRFRRDNGS